MVMPVLLAFLIAFFNQLSGINAVLYFAPRIFEYTGLAANAALLQSSEARPFSTRYRMARTLYSAAHSRM